MTLAAALNTVSRKASKVATLNAQLAEATIARDAAMLAAANEGASYAALGEAAGVGVDNVYRVLRTRRRATS